MTFVWLALAACYSEADYSADYYRTACDLTFECYAEDSLALLPYASADACYDWFVAADEDIEASSDCTFDANSGKDCIRDFEALSCEDFQAGTYPESCSSVCT